MIYFLLFPEAMEGNACNFPGLNASYVFGQSLSARFALHKADGGAPGTHVALQYRFQRFWSFTG